MFFSALIVNPHRSNIKESGVSLGFSEIHTPFPHKPPVAFLP